MASGQFDQHEAAKDQEKTPSGLALAWMYGALAMQLTGSVVGGGLSGYVLDRQLGTQPICTISLLLMGCTAGIVLLIRGLKQLESR